MADLIVFGKDIVANPSVGTNSTGGTLNQGTATLQDGIRVFQDDDVIVFNVVNLDAHGEVIPGTGLADVTVYESLEAYRAGVVKYSYRPQNPGQTANAQTDISGNGDPYVRFISTDILRPENGGPSFNQLFIAPNTDIATRVPAGEDVVFNRNASYDFNGDGDAIDLPVERGDNRFFVGDYVTPVVCFTAGTLIRTPAGSIPAEQLVPGSRVITLVHGVQVVRWVGRRRVPAAGDLAPIRIGTDVLGNDRPLMLSPNHRVLITNPSLRVMFGSPEVLVAAKHLIGRPGVTRLYGGSVDYVHFQFDHHEIVWANGARAESLCPLDCDPNNPGEGEGRAEHALIFANVAENKFALGPSKATARPVIKAREAKLVLSA